MIVFRGFKALIKGNASYCAIRKCGFGKRAKMSFCDKKGAKGFCLAPRGATALQHILGACILYSEVRFETSQM